MESLQELLELLIFWKDLESTLCWRASVRLSYITTVHTNIWVFLKLMIISKRLEKKSKRKKFQKNYHPWSSQSLEEVDVRKDVFKSWKISLLQKWLLLSWSRFGQQKTIPSIAKLSIWSVSILRTVWSLWILMQSMIRRISMPILENILVTSAQSFCLKFLLFSTVFIGNLDSQNISRTKTFSTLQIRENWECWECVMWHVTLMAQLSVFRNILSLRSLSSTMMQLRMRLTLIPPTKMENSHIWLLTFYLAS